MNIVINENGVEVESNATPIKKVKLDKKIDNIQLENIIKSLKENKKAELPTQVIKETIVPEEESKFSKIKKFLKIAK